MFTRIKFFLITIVHYKQHFNIFLLSVPILSLSLHNVHRIKFFLITIVHYMLIPLSPTLSLMAIMIS